MPTRVWLLRHAETAAPAVFHGAESDVGLSDRGRRQADAVAPVLAGHRPDGVVSSGMLRARLTAGPVARLCGLPLCLEPDLHERRIGKLCGQPTHKSDGVWPDTLARWLAGETDYAPEGAESYDELRRRVLPAWWRAVAPFEGRSVVVVAHGVVCKVILLELLHGGSPVPWMDIGPMRNVGVSELVGEPGRPAGWSAVRVNEVPGPALDV